MTLIQYDPDNWMISLTRSLGDYVTSLVSVETVDVEMSFPDTRNWAKETPLAKSLIHLEQDHIDSPVLGFGYPGREVFTTPVGYDPENPLATDPQLWRIDEAQQHHVNFDVGVWVSAEGGGATKRMELTQALVNAFTVAGAKQKMYDDTGGLWVVSFTGGHNETDRINDIPIWRALEMTLILRVFSRHAGVEQVVPDDFDQDQELTIADNTGAQVPIT